MSLALPAPDIARALIRISHEILERNSGSANITLLGIPTRGAHLAKRIASAIESIEGTSVQMGTLDITLHRDDLRLRAPRALMPTVIPSLGVEGRDVVLVDDVLFSGRTIRAALDALGEIGRPKSVQLAVHEQKDPLLIYKLEAFKLFSSMLDGVNKEVISFLFKGDLPQQNNTIQEARQVRQKQNYTETKDEVTGGESGISNRVGNEAGQTQQRPQVTETIVRETPKINRNDTVTIKHVMSGKTETMKFKKAESMLASGEWVLVHD